MPHQPDDGHGASITLGTSTWDNTALITKIECDAIEREAVRTTHNGTPDGETYTPSDLPEWGCFRVEFLGDGDAEPPYNSAPEVITIIWPVQPGASTAAHIAGNGFCLEYSPATFEAGQLIKGSAKFKWAGPYTFTHGT
jgi:hypothetical protein